jgi:signal transduction histidine kinase
MAPVWTLVFYSSELLGLITLTFRSPFGLFSWQGGATVALCVASAALFHGLFAPRFARSPAPWPLPADRAWAYFGGQALLIAALLLIDRSFVGLSFALLGQTMGSLRPSRWFLPLTVFFGLAGYGIGLFDDLQGSDWLDIVGLAFSVVIFVVMGLLVHQLFVQRFRLLHLVGELRRARVELEAAAAEREELAALRERARLAREMHDSLGHALVLVNVKLEAAERLYGRERARGDAELEATRALVRATMVELRSSLANLRAPLAEQEPLPEALRQLAEATSGRGALQVALSLPEPPPEPPPATDDALRKIAREALANVERHAGAAHAWLELARDGDGWLLRVSDDGRGLGPDDLRKPGHFGVVGMRERAASAGGSLTIAPRPGGGTVVEARVPGKA